MAWNSGTIEVPRPSVLGQIAWGYGKVYLPFSYLDTDTGYIRDGFDVSGSWIIPWSGDIDVPIIDAAWHMIVGDVWACSIDVPVPTVLGNIPSWSWGADVAIPKLLVDSSLYSGELFHGSVSLPIRITARGSYHIIPDVHGGTINVPLPSVLGYLESSLFHPFTKAVVMNVSHGGVSEYSNFSFNFFGYFNGIYFGANETGIYRLDSDSNAGVSIFSEIRIPLQDLGLPVPQRMREAWITLRSDGDMTLFVRMEEHGEWTQDISFLKNEIHESRAKIARGLSGRFASVGLRNVEGCDFDINGIRVMVEFIKRKIR